MFIQNIWKVEQKILQGVYDDYKSAIEKIKSLYAIDDKSCMKNMFYYFMKQR